MKKDPTEFRLRFAAWKNGELVYDKGRPMQHYGGGKDDLPEGFLFDTNMPELTVYGDVERARRQNNWLINRGQFPRFYSLGNGQGVKEIKFPTEQGLNIVSPEFDVIGLSPILKPLAKKTGEAVFNYTMNKAYDAGISAAKKFGGDRLAAAMYNNILPGSYYDSYIAGGNKASEILNSLKDFLNPKFKGNLNPKWLHDVNTTKMFDDFGTLVDGAMVRDEIYRNYLGLPHKNKYYIPTGRVDANGRQIYSYAVDPPRQIPLSDMQRLVDMIYPRDVNLTGKRIIRGDYLGTAGGNASHRLIDSNTDKYATYMYKDVWDVNPFKDANRAKILPKWMKSKYMHIEVLPDGYEKLVWNTNVPKWVKKILNFELSDLTRNGNAVPVETQFSVAKIRPSSIDKYHYYTDDQIIENIAQNDPEWTNIALDEISPEEYGAIEKRFRQRAIETFNKNPKQFRNKEGLGYVVIRPSEQTLHNQFGLPYIISENFNTPAFKNGKERYPNTTGGAYVPSIMTKQPTPLPKNHPLEIAGQFLPYVGTIADIKDLINGDLNKFSSVVTGTIADLFLPEIRTAAKAYKTAIKTLKHAPTPLRPVIYLTANKASRKLANSIGILIGDAINTGMLTYDAIR